MQAYVDQVKAAATAQNDMSEEQIRALFDDEPLVEEQMVVEKDAEFDQLMATPEPMGKEASFDIHAEVRGACAQIRACAAACQLTTAGQWISRASGCSWWEQAQRRQQQELWQAAGESSVGCACAHVFVGGGQQFTRVCMCQRGLHDQNQSYSSEPAGA